MSRDTTYTLPIDYLVELLGPKAAMDLCKAFGGLDRLYIPKADSLTEEHRIVQAVGMQAAKKLCTAHAMERFEIPMAKNRRRAPLLDKARRGSISCRDAAKQLGLSARRVRQIIYQQPDQRQPDLFDKDQVSEDT